MFLKQSFNYYDTSEASINYKISLSNNERRLIYILLLMKDKTLHSIITFMETIN